MGTTKRHEVLKHQHGSHYGRQHNQPRVKLMVHLQKATRLGIMNFHSHCAYLMFGILKDHLETKLTHDL
jgi:hypothetical protein